MVARGSPACGLAFDISVAALESVTSVPPRYHIHRWNHGNLRRERKPIHDKHISPSHELGSGTAIEATDEYGEPDGANE